MFVQQDRGRSSRRRAPVPCMLLLPRTSESARAATNMYATCNPYSMTTRCTYLHRVGLGWMYGCCERGRCALPLVVVKATVLLLAGARRRPTPTTRSTFILPQCRYTVAGHQKLLPPRHDGLWLKLAFRWRGYCHDGTSRYVYVWKHVSNGNNYCVGRQKHHTGTGGEVWHIGSNRSLRKT